MITAIRIEHPRDGNGIFNAAKDDIPILNELSNCNEFRMRHNKFLTPREDPLINRWPNGNEYCAFLSMDQLNHWINKTEMNELIDLGFRVLVIHISECVTGKYQILYTKSNVFHTSDITSLFISNVVSNSE